jgi:O-antigen/teichoic acid export membrane protein
MSVKAAFVRSSFWVLLGAGADNLVQFAIFVLLARLLQPADLGIVALGIVFVDVGRIFVNGGLADAIVQRRDWDPRIGSVCFTANILFATVAAALLAGLVAPLMDALYRPGSGAIVAALSIMYPLEASRAVHAAKLRREFRYRALATRSTIASLVGGAAGIAVGLAGGGPWALVTQRLAAETISTIATWRATRWVPRILLSRAVLADLAPFSSRVTIGKAVDLFNLRLPDLATGLLAGPVAVAIFRIGARSTDAVAKIAIQPFQDAAFAAFSRVGEPEAVGDAFRRVTQAAALFTFPFFLGTAVVAPDLVILLFGRAYAASGSVLALLAIGGIAATIGYFAAMAFLAAGQSRHSLRSSAVAVAANLMLCVALVPGHQQFGAAIAAAASQAVVAPLNLRTMRQVMGLDVRRLLAGLAAPFAAALTMALLLLVVRRTLLPGWSPVAVILIEAPIGALAYAGLLASIGRRHVAALADELRPMLPARLSALLAR